jgi:hypothetical protein
VDRIKRCPLLLPLLKTLKEVRRRGAERGCCGACGS